MSRALLVGFVALLALAVPGGRPVTLAEEKSQPPNPFANYDAAEKKRPEDKQVPVPDELRQQYRAFVAAIPKADANDLRSFCLPHAVVITTKPRPKGMDPKLEGINLPYLKTKFSAEVAHVRQDSKDCYLIRTATTGLFYVNTRSEGWKIWFYSDNPIE